MVERVRTPLAIPTVPRNASVDTDAMLRNAYIDNSQSGTQVAVKRPGFLYGYDAITTGTNKGIYFDPYQPILWYIDDTEGLQGIPYLGNNIFGQFWVITDPYDVGDDPVYYQPPVGPITGPWYPAGPSTGATPGVGQAGSILWSPTPFPSTRYYGVYIGQNGPTCASKEAAGYSAYAAFETHISCASKFVMTGVWREYSSASGDQIQIQQYGDGSIPQDCSGPTINFGIAPYGPIVTIP